MKTNFTRPQGLSRMLMLAFALFFSALHTPSVIAQNSNSQVFSLTEGNSPFTVTPQAPVAASAVAVPDVGFTFNDGSNNYAANPPTIPYAQISPDNFPGLDFSGTAQNFGTTDAADVTVTIVLEEVSSGTITPLGSMNLGTLTPGQSAPYSFPTITAPTVPISEGDYIARTQLFINTNVADSNPGNDSRETAYTIDNGGTLAKDDGNFIGNIGVSSSSEGVIGHTYEFQVPTTLNSVAFTTASFFADDFLIFIYSVNGAGIPTGDPIAVSETVTASGSGINEELIFNFTSPLDLTPGSYLISVKEPVNTANIAYSLDIFTPNTGFFTVGDGSAASTWSSFESVGFPITLNIRPNTTATPLLPENPEPGISDPCTCLDNASPSSAGQFGEVVEVISPTTGDTWTVISSTGLFAVDPTDVTVAATAGTVYPEIPVTGLQLAETSANTYQLNGVHVDGIGYSVTVENQDGVQLSISNECTYPSFTLTGLEENGSTNLCSDDAVITATMNFSADGIVDVTIDGAPEFTAEPVTGGSSLSFDIDPAVLGAGMYDVEISYDSGPTPNSSCQNCAPGCAIASSYEVIIGDAAATANLVCNDQIQVSLGDECFDILTPDILTEGDVSALALNVEIVGPVNHSSLGSSVVTLADIGTPLTVMVSDACNDDACWSTVIVEDKLAPTVTCIDIEYDCNEAVPALVNIYAFDNCDGPVQIEQIDESTDDSGNCTANGVEITRTYVAIDGSGNVSEPCVQVITINRVLDVDFPEDIAWNCQDYSAYNNIINPSPLAAQCNPAVLEDDSDALNMTLDGTEMGAACLANTGSGAPNIATGLYCNYAVSSDDDVLEVCGNNPNDNLFKIIRTWSVMDWCTNTVITSGTALGADVDGNEDNIQLIKVVDITDPVITVANATASANISGLHPQPCKSTGALPIATITDNCDNAASYLVYTPVGTAVQVNGLPFAGTGTPFIPAPGLAIGDHDITYVATDACGNTFETTITVSVVDDIAPSPVCDEITQVAVDANGSAIVFAETFDDGSNDNCGVDFFSARRMSDACGIAGNTSFGPSVEFCCEDIGSTVMVALRVTDFYGNSNICMTEVLVEDKIAPTFSCTSPAAVDCDSYFANLAPALDLAGDNPDAAIYSQIFADPIFGDNCGTVNFDVSVNVNVNNCGQGTVTRTYTNIDDESGNSASPSTCTQTLNVFHVNDWSIQFPADIDVTCENGEPMDFGEPEVFDDGCELIAISSEDVTYNIVVDACYKIVRTYTAINWCIYDGGDSTPVNFGEAGNDDRVRNTGCPAGTTPRYEDGGQDSSNGNSNPFECADLYLDGADTGLNPLGDDGIVVYVQTIKIQDLSAPTFPALSDLEFCIDGTDTDGTCVTDVELPLILANDCVGDLTPTVVVTGTGYASTGLNHSNLAPGIYNVELTAEDNCGNQTTADYDFEVRDCKAPTPYCVNGLVVELMETGMVELWASDFDAGSFDNCTAQSDLLLYASLVQTFEESEAETGSGNDLEITCDDLIGMNSMLSVYLYIQDEAGNVDVCQTTVVVESTTNLDPCNLVGVPLVSGALVTENNAQVQGATVSLNSGASSVTNTVGQYIFEVEYEADITITPEFNVYDNTSVTTFDLVLIRQHILTTNLLDSPYKVIAADVNNSGSVTAADLVAAKQVILGTADAYPNNNAWVFVDAAYEFPADWTLSEGYPAVTNYNNVVDDMQSDFVAVRVGDVNGTYGFGDSADERTGFIIRTEDASVTRGEEFTVEFTAADFARGYQFTLDFADLTVVSIDGPAENFGVFSDALTVSVEEKDADKLFTVTFKAKEDIVLSEVLSINSRITKAEAYNAAGEAMSISLDFNTSANNEFALYQNTPNPMKEFTLIGFNLASAGTATLTVTDLSGKVILVQEGEYARGYNEVRLNNLGATGVLYYRLETATDSAVRKMVVVE